MRAKHAEAVGNPADRAAALLPPSCQAEPSRATALLMVGLRATQRLQHRNRDRGARQPTPRSARPALPAARTGKLQLLLRIGALLVYRRQRWHLGHLQLQSRQTDR